MKRDWVLIRDILKAFEEERAEEFIAQRLEKIKQAPAKLIDGSDLKAEEWKLYGHIELLAEEEFIRGFDVVFDNSGCDCYFKITRPRLSSAGFDLLDALSTNVIWAKISRYASENAIPITFELVKAWLLKTMTMTD